MGKRNSLQDWLKNRMSWLNQGFAVSPEFYSRKLESEIIDKSSEMEGCMTPEETVYITREDAVKDLKNKSNSTGLFRQYLTEAGLYNVLIMVNLEKQSTIACVNTVKAIMKLLTAQNEEKRISDGSSICKPLYIALLVPEKARIQFLTSLIEGKSHSQRRIIQIALCHRSKENEDIFVVDTILAGKPFFAHREALAYYQPEALPHLSHTKPDISAQQRQETNRSLFLFDLFLPQFFPEKTGALPETMLWGKSWFAYRMRHILGTDLRSKSYGCMINDIHIRMGSRLHMDAFAEAELLFQNYGNVKRFAYLIAQDLLYGDGNIDEGKRVMLLGYEKYSAGLMLEIERLLKKSNQFQEVYTAIIYDEEKGNSFGGIRKFFSEEDVLRHEGKSIYTVGVIPIGTTLSTVYKVYSRAEAHLKFLSQQKAEPFPTRSYCLALVNKDLFGGSGDVSEITGQYWKYKDHSRQVITVIPNKANAAACEVKYLLPVKANWYDPMDCPLCRRSGDRSLPIIDAKHAETIPSAIFTLYDVHNDQEGKKLDWTNKETRIERLYQNLYYHHMYSGNNHFQFFLDYPSLFLQNEQEIINDLRCQRAECEVNSIVRAAIGKEDFHVLISPQQATNALFVKAVTENVFDGCVRLLQFEVEDAYREEVRAKFSYFAEEYKRLKKTNHNARIYVHYVDCSIVTGGSINRARMLVQMLLNQSGIGIQNVELFSRVFLLVNRCHRDTASNFVKDPIVNLYAYIHLKTPSYNTSNNFCPACKVREKYDRLEKRSSTQGLAKEFARLKIKHEKRQYYEYREWIDNRICDSHSYFSWLMQWCYLSIPEEGEGEGLLSFVPNELKLFYDERDGLEKEELKKARKVWAELKQYIYNEIRLSVANKKNTEESEKCNGSRQKYLEQYEKLKIQELNLDTRMDAIELIHHHLIAVRDYMRLNAMERAYSALEKVSISKERQPYRIAMLKLISEEMRWINHSEKSDAFEQQLQSVSDENFEKRFRLAYSAEWLISFVKVLSREQLANYYDYRRAITGIMSDMLNIINALRKRERALIDSLRKCEPVWGPILDFLEALHQKEQDIDGMAMRAQYQYQIYMMLMHRLSDMQISIFTDPDRTYDVLKLYDELSDCFFNQLKEYHKQVQLPQLIELPTANKMMIRYLKAIKSATMTFNDAIPCLKLAKLPDELLKRAVNQQGDFRRSLLLCARYLYLENTRMLYSGMRDMANMGLGKDVKKLLRGSLTKRFEKLGGEVWELLYATYGNFDVAANVENLLPQNSLANFCKFWHVSEGRSPAAAEKEEQKNEKVTSMLLYYLVLSGIENWEACDLETGDLPYVYEMLCRCICHFTKSQMCYIAYEVPGKYPEIIAQSGFHSELMRQGRLLTSETMESVLSLAHNVWNKEQLEDDTGEYMLTQDVAVLRKTLKKKDIVDVTDVADDYLVIHLPVRGGSVEEHALYVVVQSDVTQAPAKKRIEIALSNARNVLFMRKTLQGVLSRDYTLLANFRFDCSYLRPFRADNGDVRPSALHLTDLHIMGDVTKLKHTVREKINDAYQKYKIPKKLDLLFVTGDIVDSHEANAPRMEQNYRFAEELLREVVITLWAREDDYLPHDWRHRVIITTGNHDFAAMNQYDATQRQRALTAAMPAEGDSSAMSKFAYYLAFLSRFLDAPVDESLQNDLNEVRYYRRMDLKVLSLNCSSSATTCRTNKLGVSNEHVKKLFERETWSADSNNRESFRICAAHYSPLYEVSYFVDNYNPLPGWEWEPQYQNSCAINNLAYKFASAMQQEMLVRTTCYNMNDEPRKTSRRWKKLQNNRESFQNSMQSLRDAIIALERGTDSNVILGEPKQFYIALQHLSLDEVKKVFKNDLYMKMQEYEEWLKNDPDDIGRSNESISQMIYQIANSMKMSEQDMLQFQSVISDAGRIDLYLAGHIHAFSDSRPKTGLTSPNNLKQINRILVSNRLSNESQDAIYGYVLQEIDAKKADSIKVTILGK